MHVVGAFCVCFGGEAVGQDTAREIVAISVLADMSPVVGLACHSFVLPARSAVAIWA